MSRSFTVECDPIDQPAAPDPVERRTWCMLRIRITGRTVTRVWDKEVNEERSFLYLPAFPIVEWIVQNWWALLNESCRTDELPGRSTISAHLPWMKRHCLRSAESGLLLPALYLFNNGAGIRAEWQADAAGALPNMPAEFVDSGFDQLGIEAATDALSRFVREVLGRAAGSQDERVSELEATWRAIRNADAEEVTFCTVAGRMGLNPYDPSEVPDALAAFIEDALSDPEVPVARDLTEVAKPESVQEQWSWVTKTTAALKLQGNPNPPPIKVPGAGLSPSSHGYQLAGTVRQRAGLDATKPVSSVLDVAQAIAGASFETEHPNHVPGRGIRAVVGWRGNNSVAIAGPRPARPDNQRFLEARSLYNAVFASARGERLVTDAYTWDQQVSRAFAAELLAPRDALVARTGESADRAKVEELANEFQASAMVIGKQLGNAGVSLMDE